jgi:hypothetical protein
MTCGRIVEINFDPEDDDLTKARILPCFRRPSCRSLRPDMQAMRLIPCCLPPLPHPLSPSPSGGARCPRCAWTSTPASPSRCRLPCRPLPPGNGGTTEAGTTTALGERAAQVIANDLKSSGLFRPLDPAAFTTTVGLDDVLAPDFPAWRTIAAQALVTGTVTANPDGGITLACYAYDVFAGSEIARQGFVTTAAGWRRAAHKCADLVYSRLTGESGYFDSRIVYVSETGPRTKRIKRLAIMDQDGASHRFLTSGQNLVLTPRFAPGQQTITYMSFENNRPRVWLYTLGSGRQEAVGDFQHELCAALLARWPDAGLLDGGGRQHRYLAL